MKNKTGIISLIIGSGLWCLTDLYWIIKPLVNGSVINNTGVFGFIFHFFKIIIPLSILVFAVTSHANKVEDINEEINTLDYSEIENQN